MAADLFWFYTYRWKGSSYNNCLPCKFYLKAQRTAVWQGVPWSCRSLQGSANRSWHMTPPVNEHFFFGLWLHFESQLLRERTWRWSSQYAAKVLLTSAAGLLENNNAVALIGRGVTESRRYEAAQWSSKLKHSERRTAIILWLQENVCFTGHNEQAAVARDRNCAVPIELVYSLVRCTEKCGYFLKTSMYAHWLWL